jgi:hypothetical protein
MKLFTDVTQKAVAIERLIDRRIAAMAQARRSAPHPLETHHAILEQIEAQVTAGPGGSHLFPYDHVTLELLAADAGATAAVEAMFEHGGGLHEEIRKRLTQRDCEMPAGLTCSIRRVTTSDWPPDATYRLTFRRTGEEAGDKKHSQCADLILALPSGEPGPAYRLADRRINVGRIPEARDRHGRLIRRNTMSVSDEYDPRATVSRCHAHVDATFHSDRPAGYIVYDDASTYGTRVVRDGQAIVVHPGTVGVRLRDGDEIYFGAARANFRVTRA